MKYLSGTSLLYQAQLLLYKQKVNSTTPEHCDKIFYYGLDLFSSQLLKTFFFNLVINVIVIAHNRNIENFSKNDEINNTTLLES